MISSYLRTVSGFNRNVGLLLAAQSASSFVVFGIYPVIFNLYLLRLGFGTEFIGLVNGAGPLAAGALAIPAGLLGRRVGVRKALIGGSTVALFSFLLLPLGELFGDGVRAVWFLVAYATGYSGMGAFLVNARPFLAGSTDDESRGHAFSALLAVSGVAGFVGALLGGLLPGVFASLVNTKLTEPGPYRLTLLIGATVFVGALISVWSTRSVTAAESAPSGQGRAPLALIVMVATVTLLGLVGEGAARSFLNVFMEDTLSATTAQIGIYVGVAQLLSVPAAMVMPAVVRRIPLPRFLALGYVLRAVAMLPLAYASTTMIAGSSFVGLVVVVSMMRPASILFHQEIVAVEWRSSMAGATTATGFLGLSGLVISGGFIIPAFGFNALFLAAAAITAVAAVLFWFWFGSTPPSTAARGQ